MAEIQNSESSNSSSAHRQFHENEYYNFNYDAVYVINPLLGEVMMLPQVNQSEGHLHRQGGRGESVERPSISVIFTEEGGGVRRWVGRSTGGGVVGGCTEPPTSVDGSWPFPSKPLPKPSFFVKSMAAKVQKSESSNSSSGHTPLDQYRFIDYNNEAVYIINPLLGEVMMLPQVNQSGSMEFVFYGFGCSRHSGLYKVLRFVIRSCERTHGEILTIGVDHKWRSFEKSSVPYIRYIYSHGVNLNGVVYFIGDGDAVGFPFGFILAFDVEEERGHLIPLPSEFGDALCLSVLANNVRPPESLGFLMRSHPPFPLHEDLAYVFDNEVIYIMNPILGEVITLPQVNRTENTENVVYGFDFSAQSDHYKVVRFVRKNDGHVHGEIFTIGVDHKWRCFEDSSLPFLSFYCGITCNGVLYFDGYEECLYAFEIEEEKGHLIPLPYEFGDHMNYIIFITACNDNICLADSNSEHQVVIWTLKRYGVVESWSREIILESWISFDLHHDRLLPITTLRNGDLLMLRHESLYEDKGLISYGEGAHVLFFEYSPSFFPLNTVLWKDVCI
ncbi:hypothetical protein RD792_013754 [Penstemon davidsonii]|uniref:F-box associated beta-propeller type 3 domain-containing protein n=1 Tax=Penstemon davidsonii TaxID=160366 RepID=A0ABR0CUE3_9LAMI|nr:hypothetical protein RD792_013754 [Penstemon davidsonii]